MGHNKYLILEKQDNLREMINFIVQSEFSYEAQSVNSTAELVQLLAQHPDEYDFVIIGSMYDESTGEDFFKYFIENYNDSNILLYQIVQDSFESFNFENYKPDGLILREYFCEEIRSLLSYNLEKMEEKVDEYTPISISCLYYIDGMDKDLYIKIGNHKYIKRFREEDGIDEDALTNYANKGLNYLYIQKEFYQWVLKNIQVFSQEIANNENFKLDMHINHEETFAQDVLDEVHETVNKKMKDYSKIVSKNMQLKKFLSNLKVNPKLETYLENKNKITATIACGLAKELNWGSEKTYEKLIYCSVYHDILLRKNPLLSMVKDLNHFDQFENNFTEEEKKLFLDHPEITSKIIESDPYAPIQASEIVLHHHEKLKSGGFPTGINHKRLPPMSTLFIISLDMAHYILTNQKWTVEGFYKEYKNNYAGPVSNKILKELRNLFKTF